jgi:hypothetical protein
MVQHGRHYCCQLLIYVKCIINITIIFTCCDYACVGWQETRIYKVIDIMYDTWKTAAYQIPMFPLLTFCMLLVYWNPLILPILLTPTHTYIIIIIPLCNIIKLCCIVIVKEWPLPQLFPFMLFNFYPIMAAITGWNIS